MVVTHENLMELAEILESSAAHGVPTHVYVFHESVLLLQWSDASDGSSPFFVSSKVPEEKVREFCGLNNCQYQGF